MGALDVVQVYRALADRRRRRRETYSCILRSCEKHIQNVAARDGMRCVFAVPEFRVGLPTFDINECTRFVRAELEKAGFAVRYYFPNLLQISWDVADLERMHTQEQAQAQVQVQAQAQAQTPQAQCAGQQLTCAHAPQAGGARRRERGGAGKFFLELE